MIIPVLVVLFSLVVNSAVSADDAVSCDSAKACTATCNGTQYDVSRFLSSLNPARGTIDGKVYEFDFSCSGTQCGIDNINTAVCQRETNGGKQSWSLGKADSDIKWSIEQQDPLILKVAYSNGDMAQEGMTRNSMIVFSLDTELTDVLAFTREKSDAAQYRFDATVSVLSHIQARPNNRYTANDPPPGIVGFSIIAISVIGLTIYFIVGGAIMYIGRGARGLEIIPNVNFWKELPFLIEDGVRFTFPPCTIRRISYNTI